MSTNVEKLPRQARRQLEQVAEIEASIAATANPEAALPAEPEAPPAPAAVAPAATEKVEDWEQKFKTLQGIVTANNNRMTTLEGQLTVANAKLAAIAEEPTPKPAPATKEPLLTAADTETFGPEMIDLIQRAAQQVAAEAIGLLQSDLDALRRENVDLKAKLGGVAEQQGLTQREHYYTELAKVVPDWHAHNGDERFVEWLKAVDPLSGLQRQAYLNVAFENFNVPQTVALFKAWLSTVAPVTTPAAEPTTTVNPLERQVQPNSSRNVTPEAPNANDTKVFTSAEVKSFYADVAKGKYRGRDGDRAKLEQQIDAAAASGRVR